MKKMFSTVIITICCVMILEIAYVKLSSPLTILKTVSSIRKFPNIVGSSFKMNSLSVNDQINSLQKSSDSLAEKHRLLLKEYSYYSLKDKLSRKQTIARVKEMKDITNLRLEIEHKIDSLLLLKKKVSNKE